MLEIEAVEYIGELFRAEQGPGHATRDCHDWRPATAFVAIGAWQLAMRHPEFSPDQATMINQLISQLRPLFAGTLGEELLKLGDRPEYDIPRGCRYPFGPHAPECPPGDHPGFVP